MCICDCMRKKWFHLYKHSIDIDISACEKYGNMVIYCLFVSYDDALLWVYSHIFCMHLFFFFLVYLVKEYKVYVTKNNHIGNIIINFFLFLSVFLSLSLHTKDVWRVEMFWNVTVCCVDFYSLLKCFFLKSFMVLRYVLLHKSLLRRIKVTFM